MVAYQVVKEAMRNHEIGAYTAFGICAYHVERTRKEKIAQYSDVFLNTEAAERFVAVCNKLQLDVVHLPEVIEDAILAS